MKKILSHKRFWSIFWAVAAVACMIVIFVMSHQPAEDSAHMSGIIAEWLMKLGIKENSAVSIETIVRKCAHMLEYFGLCFCICMHVHVRNGKLNIRNMAVILTICISYAVSDEVHQLFIEGRAGQIRDVLIDTSGAVIALILVVIFETLNGCGIQRKL
ncbi:MAG: VanZ family protein [Lachnospiraceae bacterium]|nr:VanZ family protein [Lachnospiraceae bacterium]